MPFIGRLSITRTVIEPVFHFDLCSTSHKGISIFFPPIPLKVIFSRATFRALRGNFSFRGIDWEAPVSLNFVTAIFSFFGPSIWPVLRNGRCLIYFHIGCNSSLGLFCGYSACLWSSACYMTDLSAPVTGYSLILLSRGISIFFFYSTVYCFFSVSNFFQFTIILTFHINSVSAPFMSDNVFVRQYS